MELQKRVVWSYSRMNPPTAGHVEMLRRAVKIAKEKQAQFILFLSKTEDKKKNPLTWQEKIKIIKELKIAGLEVCEDPEVSNIIAVYRTLAFGGVTDQWCLCGPDRKAEYDKFAVRNATRFDTSDVIVPSGDKRFSVDGEEVSATLVREAALADDFQRFSKLVAPVSEKTKRDIFDKIRTRIVLKKGSK